MGRLTKLKTYVEKRKIIGPPTGPKALNIDENSLIDPPAGIRGEVEVIAYLRSKLHDRADATDLQL